MSKRETSLVFVGLLVLVGAGNGCHSRAELAERPDAAISLDESDGPRDGDWKRWLTPPPPDQPQPKLVCDRPLQEVAPIWEGAITTYTWEFANGGQVPLRVWLFV